MIAENIDPAVDQYPWESLLSAEDIDDPYKKALAVRAALCAASLKIRPRDSASADQLLEAERAIADATRNRPSP